MKDVSKAYGGYIKNKRAEKGMTQAEVSKKLGISQQAYGRYELGSREPNLDLMIQISEILEFKVGDFFDWYIGASHDRDTEQE